MYVCVCVCVCVGRKGGGEISNCIIANFGCKALNNYIQLRGGAPLYHLSLLQHLLLTLTLHNSQYELALHIHNTVQYSAGQNSTVELPKHE